MNCRRRGNSKARKGEREGPWGGEKHDLPGLGLKNRNGAIPPKCGWAGDMIKGVSHQKGTWVVNK